MKPVKPLIMKSYKMNIAGFVNPFWMRQNWYKIRGQELTVAPDGCIHYDGVKIRFVDESLPAGTKVIMDTDSWIWAMKVEDHQAKVEKAKQEQRKRQQVEEERRRKIEEQARVFHESIDFPVTYSVGRKAVLSGLSLDSWGDGQKKNSVHHLLLEEDFQSGRLQRKAGDFLCTSLSGNNGKLWVDPRVKHGQSEYMPEVTCKQCLKIISKFRKDG
jgi:hypothetical protein